ncbi:MAG TPA: flagellar basal-body MS-ring/collar protein FliF [Rhodopila sp.]|uniref:flagellar basal-body MS-ring/collar protein FliF n=1 Tax=Rhodopila sp. TaxID=2480087 RepID=UPI002C985664|nr:flagellar basal-body MS-ring/collar protein FliF [Rhodopila sp.]HVY15124.1 flagellar basal-body MS-ring/collar protein FliF [Rhodopila sp.]
MQGLLETIRKLGMVRVAVIVALTLGTLGSLAVLELWGGAAPRMAVLATNLDPQDSQDLLRALDSARLNYRFDPQTRQVLVAEADLDAARALRPGGGGPAASLGGTGPGYEIFDDNGMLLTDFEQQIRLTRALEGELSRTITSVRGIQRARVHIVLPHRQPFERQKTEAQASVMLTLAGHGTLSNEAVRSVVDLIAAAVPGLSPNAITVVDSNLHLLARAGSDDELKNSGARADDLRQRMETRLSQAVELMLERSLGVGHVHVEASVALNFDKVSEKQERFDPDSSAVRSTQAVTTNNKTTDKVPGVSVQNNLPNADSGATATGSQEARQEETTNYEITRDVREIVHDQPHIDRISLAVLVDGMDTVDASGKRVFQPRPQAELDQISRLVKSAVGFDEKRGDRLELASMPFATTMDVPDPPATPAKPVPVLRNAELTSFIQLVVFGTIGLITIVLTARSIFSHLAEPPRSFIVKGMEPALAGPDASMALTGAPMGSSDEGRQMLLEASGAWEDPIEQVYNSPIAQRVRELIDKDPALAARVLEKMIEEEGDEED